MNARQNRRRKATATKRLKAWRLAAPRRAREARAAASKLRIEEDVRQRAEDKYQRLRREQLALCPMEEHIKAQSIPDLQELQRQWFQELRGDPYRQVWFQHYDPRRFSQLDFDTEPSCVVKPMAEALQFLSEELTRRMSGSLRW